MAGELSLSHFGWLSLSGMAVVAAPGTPLWLLPALGFVGHICYDVSPELQSQVRPLLAAAGSHARAALPASARRLFPAAASQASAPEGGRAYLADDDPLGAEEGSGSGAPSLPPIGLVELARSPNILIVGSPGSGKSTLLHALIATRPWRSYLLDPHSHPGKWPEGASVIGGGRNFPAIYAALQRAETTLTSRAQQLSTDARARFTPFTLAGDEWGSVCSEITVDKHEDPPGRLLTRLLKEGRKFGISFVGAAHGDTAASLGSAGDTQAFRYSFDWIVYMGGFVAQQLKDLPSLVRALPTGRTPEGKVFPLIVVATSPITGERRLLDLRHLETVSVSTAPQPKGTAVTIPLTATSAPGDRTDGRADDEERPAETRAAPNDWTNGRTDERAAIRDRDDLIRLLVRQGWKVTQIRELIKGTNTEIGDLVRRIEDELINERSA